MTGSAKQSRLLPRRQSGLLPPSLFELRRTCRRFAPRNDGGTHVLILATGFRPSYSINLPPPKDRRAQGVPDAGRTREPCVQRKVHIAHASNTGSAETTGIPRANGVTAYTRSPRCAGLSGHRRLAFVTRGLIPASGDRDNTTSPSVSTRSSGAPARPSHPASHARDDRETPLWRRRDERETIIFFRKTEAKYFCGEGLTCFW